MIPTPHPDLPSPAIACGNEAKAAEATSGAGNGGVIDRRECLGMARGVRRLAEAKLFSAAGAPNFQSSFHGS